MFGRSDGTKTQVADTALTAKKAVGDAAEAVVDYVDPLARDEKLRQRLAAAIVAGAAARNRMRRQTGLTGFARRLASDPVLHAQLAEMAAALQAAQRRAKRARSHRLRNTILFSAGVAMTVAAVPAVRDKVTSLVRGRRDQWGSVSPATIEEQIEVAVPVSTTYNQWMQFEEFPKFMEGVDEVRQLDDTLLHWAATIGGKHLEWDAKIVEQQPDRVIAWESTDGKQTRGTVRFEEAGPARTRVRLRMSYRPEGVTEKIGSAIGIDSRRIRGDLERFRELIESRQSETGAWRGEIKAGKKTSARTSSTE
jgi:uncharacterized membrane protein